MNAPINDMTGKRAAEQLGVRSARDLVEYARANPARLNYASGGNGTILHLSGESLKSMAGIGLTHIPYTGAGPAIVAQLDATTLILRGQTADVDRVDRPEVAATDVKRPVASKGDPRRKGDE